MLPAFTRPAAPAARRSFSAAAVAALPALTAALLLATTVFARGGTEAPPRVGDIAPDHEWTALDGGKVRLSTLSKKAPVVLVVLRGFPGYQCPVCTAQVGSLLGKVDRFSAAGAQVVLVYPGPADGLKRHAGEFVTGKNLPANFRLVLDPDYAFTNRYGLRWDAPNETAYPSTFVLDRSTGKVAFAKVSRSHGGRASAEEVLAALGSK